MRVLMLSTPFHTHFTPMVPLACALRAAGHEVLVAGQPEVVDAAHSAGLCTASVGERFHANDVLSRKLRPGVRPLQVAGPATPAMLAAGSRIWEMHAKYLLPTYLDLARSWGADLIVSEQMEFTGPIIGAVLGVPAVRHRWGIDALTGPTRESVRLFLAGACERLGLPGFPEDSRWLDPCPPPLQVPDLVRGIPIRPSTFNGAGEMPGWAFEPGSARRVCVCLGRQTLKLNGIGLLRGIVAAFDGLSGVEAVVTVEPEFQEHYADAPANVRIVDPTPLDLILGNCAAVVHHGGASIAMAAASYGIPQLTLPQFMDQFTVGERVVATGVGRSIGTAEQQDDPAVVRDNLRALLDDPGHERAAADVRAATAAMPSPAQVAGDLERLAA